MIYLNDGVQNNKNVSTIHSYICVKNILERAPKTREKKDLTDIVDILTISQESKLLADNRDFQSPIEEYIRQLDNIDESREKMDETSKCLEIARRIAKGDKVPRRDEKKLMEFNAQLYHSVKLAAMINANKKNKKHKSLFKDEDEENLKKKIRELNREESNIQSVTQEFPDIDDKMEEID